MFLIVSVTVYILTLMMGIVTTYMYIHVHVFCEVDGVDYSSLC